MKPDKIILVRHGQSEGNVNREVYTRQPDYSVNLTPTGRQQAEEAGRKLFELTGGDACFYVSPFYRTQQTFHEISKAFPPISRENAREEARIREQEWTGRMISGEYVDYEQEREAYGSYFYRFQGGESCADVEDRISCFLNSLHRDFASKKFPKNVVIVSHGMAMRVFLKRWLKLTVDEFELLRNPRNCQVIVLQKNKVGKYELTQPLEQYPRKRRRF